MAVIILDGIGCDRDKRRGGKLGSFSRLEIFASSYCQWQIGLEVTFREKKENGKGNSRIKILIGERFTFLSVITSRVVSFPFLQLA